MNRQSLIRIQNDILSLYYYARMRSPKHWGWLPLDEEKLIKTFSQLNVPVQDFHLVVDDYREYFDHADYANRYSQYYPWNIAEKSLEHFIAQLFLQLKPTDIYIDIASEGSPVPEIYHRLYGCKTYAQDLSYELGIHDNRIGSDAASLPLSDGSVTKMALHCSFEHFEGDADSGFIREVERVLKVDGKIVIVPLYLNSHYSILTDPLFSRANQVNFEQDAIVTAVKGWGNRHGRFYDPAHLVSRVLEVTKNLNFKLMRLMNAKDVSDSTYARFVLVGTKISI